MLINLFGKSYLMQYIMLLMLTIILWSGSFINPVIYEADINEFLSPGFALLHGFSERNNLLSVLLAFIILVFGAFLFNYTLTKNDLVPKNILIPALVFIVLMSHSPGLLSLHPVMISSVLIIIVLFFLFQVYSEKEAYPQIFNAGFLTGIASFFYFPSLYFVLFIYLTFIIYRLYHWREWLIVLFGVATPYIFLWVYYFWFDKLGLAFDAYNEYFINITIFSFNYSFSFIDYLVTALIILLFLWSFFVLIGDLREKTISVRKRYWSVLWLFFVALGTFILSQSQYNTHAALVLMPVSIFIAYGFSQVRKKIWLEITFGILIIFIIINNLITAFS